MYLFTLLTVKHCEKVMIDIFIDSYVDVTLQSIPVLHTYSTKALLCERKALAAKMDMNFTG